MRFESEYEGNMDNECEQVFADFNNSAQRLFFLTYENFSVFAKQLNRQQDENVFQQQLGKYLRTLKLQLEGIAEEVIQKNKSLKEIDRCNKLLTEKIDFYLNEFRQKSRSI